jgi:flavin-dependent dehydrogenase
MDKIYDVLVIGGGLSGFACAVKSAQNGKSVLLIERRPVLGWESTWACQLDFSGTADSVAQSVIKKLSEVSGFKNNRTDAPILEMALDRMADETGVNVLLYSYPVRVIFDGDTAFGVVIGNKSGEQILKARIIVDATEEALLWRQTEYYEDYKYTGVDSKQVIFFNNAEGEIKLPMGLDDGIMLYPSIWKGEVLAEFEVGDFDIISARDMIVDVVEIVRDEVPQLKDALVSHSANELFPASPLFYLESRRIEHPVIKNLFGAGIWSKETENTPVSRLNLGERVGEIASRCEGAKDFPDEMMTGSVLKQPEEIESDVIVVGGGTGGAIAAISAGREGARTMLIEASPILGGIGTGGAIHSYYHGVNGGIQDEVDERLRELTPILAGKWRVTGFHPEAKKIVLQQMLEEAGVDIRLNTVVSGVLFRDEKKDKPTTAVTIPDAREHKRRLKGVIAVGPDGVSVHNAKAFIDSTGDGDVAVMAGAPFTIGRERDNLMHAYSQPCGNLAKDGGLSFMNFDAGYVDPTDVTDLTRGRRFGINIFWRDEFNEDSRLLYIAPIIGLRQSRQIIGEYQLTLADEVSGRRFEDVVSYTVAHYDNHGHDYENDSDEAALWVWALGNWGKVFGCEVPYRCMIPKNVDGLLLACRAISMTYDAHMEFRMQKDIQRLGEVAGIASAMCARKGITPGEIDIKGLQILLKERGFLDEKYRPKPAIPSDKPLELPSASEVDAEKANELVWVSTYGERGNAVALKGMLNSNDPIVRFKASAALAWHGINEGVGELLKCLEERNSEQLKANKTVPIWQSAIPFLGMAGDKRAVPALLNVLKDEKASLDALIAVVRALERIGDESVISALREFLKRENMPTERVMQISTGTTLRPVVDDARWQIELAVADTMLKLGVPHDEIQQIIKPHIEDKRAYVRRYANRLMEQI